MCAPRLFAFLVPCSTVLVSGSILVVLPFSLLPFALPFHPSLECASVFGLLSSMCWSSSGRLCWREIQCLRDSGPGATPSTPPLLSWCWLGARERLERSQERARQKRTALAQRTGRGCCSSSQAETHKNSGRTIRDSLYIIPQMAHSYRC